jgi:hypothetical protein
VRDSELVVDHGRGEAVALGGACGLLLPWPWASFDVRGPPAAGQASSAARGLLRVRALAADASFGTHWLFWE